MKKTFFFTVIVLYMYDTIVIGSGIAGLYSAYKLGNTNMCILEKEKRIGGRIMTFCIEDMLLEAGAGRFNNHHKILMSLIDELNLKSKINPIAGEITFSPSGPYDEKYIGRNPFDILEPVFERSKNEPIEKLQKYKFINYAKTILSKKDIQFVLDSFGYYEQIVHMNTYNALKLLTKGMHSKNNFFTLQDGMSQIITELEKRLKCPIYTSQDVYRIEYSSDVFKIYVRNRKTPYITKQCICALPKSAVEKIPFFNPVKSTVQKVGIKILCRMYAQFKKKDVWFQDIPKTTTNNENRYIIPINKEKGIIMISYTDSKYAQYWKSLPCSRVLVSIKRNIYKTFGIHINDPTFFRAFYWDTGTSFWKSNCDSRILSKRMLQPYEKVPLYVCGESFSQTQGWMEGALETSDEVLKMLKRK